VWHAALVVAVVAVVATGCSRSATATAAVTDVSARTDSPLWTSGSRTVLPVRHEGYLTYGNYFLRNAGRKPLTIRSIRVVGAVHVSASSIWFHIVELDPPTPGLVGTAETYPPYPAQDMRNPVGWTLSPGRHGSEVQVVVGLALAPGAPSGSIAGFEIVYSMDGARYRLVSPQVVDLTRST